MKCYVMTLFPEMVEEIVKTSILGRAAARELVTVKAVNIRDYSADLKHRKVDDYTYGGGAGMLMQAQPVYDCYQAILDMMREGNSGMIPEHRVIYLSPQGHVFRQEEACALAEQKTLVFLCGHYEGIDERVLEEIVTDEVSIGDYVLTGGELPAMVMIDAIARFVPGVLNNEESALSESLSGNLLEYPQYSRPEVWRGKNVPEILLSGDHAKVDAWRKEQSILRTREKRPDLYDKYLACLKETE